MRMVKLPTQKWKCGFCCCLPAYTSHTCLVVNCSPLYRSPQANRPFCSVLHRLPRSLTPFLPHSNSNMVSTRANGRVQQQTGTKEPQQQHSGEQQAQIPSSAEQEKQLQADRAMIDVYRKDWQANKGVSHAAWRYVLQHSVPGGCEATTSAAPSRGAADTACAVCLWLCRHVRDVLWWMEHVCGINMLDYEEKVLVVCIILTILVLIILGAYKQSTQLVRLLKQLAMPGSA